MKREMLIIAILFSLLIIAKITVLEAADGDVPGMINYQGKVSSSTVDIGSTGDFKFAIVNTAGTTSYWSNDGTSSGGAAPTASVSVAIDSSGNFNVLLGDTSLTGMSQSIPVSVFTYQAVYLRIWFSHDDESSFQLLSPDKRLVTSPFAFRAQTLATIATLTTPVIDSESTDPSTTTAGTLYYNSSDNKLYVRDNSSWVDLTSQGNVIGSEVCAWDNDLDDIAALSHSDGNFLVSDGADWVAENAATAKTSIGLGNVANIDCQSSFTMDDAAYLATDEIRARDSGGLKLYEDAGSSGIQIADDATINIGADNQSGDAWTRIVYSDGTTNNISYPLQLTHECSGTAAAGIGTGINLRIEDSAGNLDDAARIASIFTTATSGSEESVLAFYTTDVGEDNIVERMRLDKDGLLSLGTTTAAAELHVKGNLSSKIAGTVSVSGSAVLSGSGTDFLAEVNVGDAIKITDGSNTEIFTVSGITNETTLSLDGTPSNSYSGADAYVDPDVLLQVDNGDDVAKLVVRKNSNIGINTAGADTPLHVLKEEQGPDCNIMTFDHATNSAVDNDHMDLIFRHENDGSEMWTFAEMQIIASDVSDGTEAGAFALLIANGTNGDPAERMRIANDGVTSLNCSGTATDIIYPLIITNDANADGAMTDTRTSLLFQQYYYDASTPASVDLGKFIFGTEGNWTSTASTQDSYLGLETVINGSATERLRINSAGDVLIGTAAADSTSTNTLVIANGTPPGGNVADAIQLYAEDAASSSELKVRDEAGNVATLSPHNFSLMPKSEEMAWSFYCVNNKTGQVINVDMLRVIRLVEQLTGQKLVFIEDVKNITE